MKEVPIISCVVGLGSFMVCKVRLVRAISPQSCCEDWMRQWLQISKISARHTHSPYTIIISTGDGDVGDSQWWQWCSYLLPEFPYYPLLHKGLNLGLALPLTIEKKSSMTTRIWSGTQARPRSNYCWTETSDKAICDHDEER